MSNLIRGENLNEQQRREVLAAYVYRNTVENRIISERVNPSAEITLTDREWIKTKAFYINKDGSLSRKHQRCEPVYMAD